MSGRGARELTDDDAKLFIGNLSYHTREERLTEAFGKYGAIKECRVALEPGSERSRGYAFVTMEDPVEAAICVKNLSGQDLDGRLIKVELATGTRGSGGNNRKGGGGGGDRYGGRRDRDRGDRNSIRENRDQSKDNGGGADRDRDRDSKGPSSGDRGNANGRERSRDRRTSRDGDRGRESRSRNRSGERDRGGGGASRNGMPAGNDGAYKIG